MTPAQRPRPARSTQGTMTLPALWRDLRREFEELADPGLLDASAPRRLKASGGEIVGGTASLRFQFTQFAQRGGVLLGASRKTAVARWLRRLQADLQQAQNSSLSDLRITTTKYRASDFHERIVTTSEWEIDRVSAASVDSCIALETQARRLRPITRRAASGASAHHPPVTATAFDLRHYDLTKTKDRGDAVLAFIEGLHETGLATKRITQADFWRVAGYPSRHAYYQWKSGNAKTPRMAPERFRVTLALSPSAFLTRARNKRPPADS